MKLSVLYDAGCGLCCRARDWLARQPKYVALEFVPAGSQQAARLFPGLEPAATLRELHVVADDGRVWSGAAAWVMCLWALRTTRAHALRLADPVAMRIAKRVVLRLSEGRYGLSRALRMEARRS